MHGGNPLKVHSVEIEGLKVIELDIWRDSRGYFAERFHQEKFRELGLPLQYMQDNHSRSAPHVLRGLHIQTAPQQGKLVGVIRGRIWDVAVDLRKGSPTFGKYLGLELNDENGLLVWIPEGFAHGFCVLGDQPADVYYKVDALYHPKSDHGILWSDQDLKIQWPDPHPIISEKDQKLPSLQTFLNSWH